MTECVCDPCGTTMGVSKRVCIIGAGANGLATLKVLSELHQVQTGQWSLIAFEERDKVGGIWYPAPPSENPPLTPLYDSLCANLPIPVMAFPSFSFPLETSPYPTASVVYKYLEDYATHFDLLRYVRLCTRVEKLFWDSGSRKKWDVTLSTGEELEFDFVVVANGHYRKPRYPDTPGLQSWLDSGRAMHSAWFRRPDPFAHHRKILLVGGGPSAVDLRTDLVGVVPLLLHSLPDTKRGSYPYPDDTEIYRKVVRVAEYRDDGSVLLIDGSTESDIDLVILATGYEMSFPFLPQIKQGIPPIPPPLPSELYNSTYHVFPLAYQLFPLRGDFPPTSIAFSGLTYMVGPFPLFEAQARAIARVLESPESLDTLACAVDITSRAHKLMHEEGIDDPLRMAKRWSRLAKLIEPYEYRSQLLAFSGESWKVSDREFECWKLKDEMRREWRAIEQSGKAKEWLKGVGANGPEDWLELCLKIVKRNEPKL